MGNILSTTLCECCIKPSSSAEDDNSNSTSSSSSPLIKNNNHTIPKAIINTTPVFAPGAFNQKYTIGKLIGNGSSSVCHICTLKENPDTSYACKIIDRVTNETSHDDIEIQVLQSLSHPNIISLIDVYKTDEKIYMVTELMNKGELFDYIVQKKTLSEAEASSIIRSVTSAVAYMHESGIVHRDLKPENLLLNERNEQLEVKIIDFGLAKMLETSDMTTSSFLGTRGYLAPEMLRRSSYSKSVDVWALGIITYVLLCGCLPFDDDGSTIPSDAAARAKFGLKFPKWASGLSNSAKDLLRCLLSVDLSKRYTASQALGHPWVLGKDAPANVLLESPKHMKRIATNFASPNKTNMRSSRKSRRSQAAQGETISHRRQSR